MEIEDFHSIEFGICVKGDAEDEFYRIPIDDSVRTSLVEMYDTFYKSFETVAERPDTFQTSEKYATTERLLIPLDDEMLETIRSLYDETHIQVQSVNLSEAASNIIYYFTIFRIGTRTKKIAVKRPSQFKGLLKKRLIHFVDDTLQVIPDDVFKLDHDFDFIITKLNVEILHPIGFVFIANIDEEIQKTAISATMALGHKLGFIDFDSIAQFVGTSKTAAKLVASIRTRSDLKVTSREKLVKSCKRLGVKVKTVGGKVVPEEDSIIDFLQILDRREYDVDVTTEEPEIYIAASRKKVK